MQVIQGKAYLDFLIIGQKPTSKVDRKTNTRCFWLRFQEEEGWKANLYRIRMKSPWLLPRPREKKLRSVGQGHSAGVCLPGNRARHDCAGVGEDDVRSRGR